MNAETRLRAALEAAQQRFADIAAGRAFQPRLHAATGATEAAEALAAFVPPDDRDLCSCKIGQCRALTERCREVEA